MTRTPEDLDRTGANSLYEQVSSRIRTWLENLDVGARVPTEAELGAIFKVGRMTVRKAVQCLVDEGLLVRRQGMGTFVAAKMPRIVHPIDRVFAFVDTFRRNSEEYTMRMMDFGWKEGGDLPETLARWPRPILQYRKLFLSRGIPHAITQVYLPNTIARGITIAEIETNNLYKNLIEKLGIELSNPKFLVSCRQPSPVVREALELSPGVFLLVLERITHDAAGNPVEMTVHYLRPDVYQLSVQVGGQ